MVTAIDVKLKNWGESGSMGPWLKFDIADPEDLEPFKTKKGSFFKMILVEVDDNGNPLYGEKAEEAKVSLPYGEQALKPEPFKFQGMRASQYAAMVTRETVFWQYAGALSTYEANLALKEVCKIESKAELDRDSDALNRFADYMKHYFIWAQKNASSVIVSANWEDEGLSIANEN